jgi:dihydrofolate reductase
MVIKAIAAMSVNRVIGFNNSLPWYLPEDLKRVKQLTWGHFLLMGRKTYESLPTTALKGRSAIVLSSNINKISSKSGSDFYCVNSVAQSVKLFKDKASSEQSLWIFGGGSVYAATIDLWEEVYLTVIKNEFVGDTFLIPFEKDFIEVERESYPNFDYIKYKRY